MGDESRTAGSHVGTQTPDPVPPLHEEELPVILNEFRNATRAYWAYLIIILPVCAVLYALAGFVVWMLSRIP